MGFPSDRKACAILAPPSRLSSALEEVIKTHREEVGRGWGSRLVGPDRCRGPLSFRRVPLGPWVGGSPWGFLRSHADARLVALGDPSKASGGGRSGA